MKFRDEDMVPVPLENFFQGIVTNVDVYVRTGQGNYFLLLRSGDVFERSRLENYQNKNLKELHVSKEQYSLFADRQITVAGIVVEKSKAPVGNQVSFLAKTAGSVHQEVMALDMSPEAFERSRQITQSILTLVESRPPLLNLMKSLLNVSDLLLKHSIATGMVSTMIAHGMGWTRRETLEKLNLGGFLHDIGKKELPKALLEKTRAEQSYDDIKDYENHPYRGLQILESIEIVPEDVIAITYEHHETSIGQGYPRRLWDVKLNPLSRVVALANVYCELTLPVLNRKSVKTPMEALSHIQNIMGQPFNKEAFKALRALVHKDELSTKAS